MMGDRTIIMRNLFYRETDPTKRAIKRVGGDLGFAIMQDTLRAQDSMRDILESRIAAVAAGELVEIDFQSRSKIVREPYQEAEVNFRHVSIVEESSQPLIQSTPYDQNQELG